MKNLSNYINERLVLSKTPDYTLSKIKLKNDQFIMRVGDFYCWYFGVDKFDDITQDMVDTSDPWFEQVDNGSFKNQYDVYDFLSDFVWDKKDYVVAEQKELPNVYDISFTLDGIYFTHDCTDPIPDDIIIRKK